MLIDCFGHTCVFETLPGGFFIRLPFIGQASIVNSTIDWNSWKAVINSREFGKDTAYLA